MKTIVKKSGSTYPHSMRKVYLNLFTAVLSVLLALMLLSNDPLTLLGYIVFSASVIMIVFRLKTHPLNLQKRLKTDSSESEENSHKWRWLILMFVTMIVILASPFLLAAVLPPYIWLAVIVGVGTGLSVAEVLFYVYRRKRVT